MLSWRKIQYPMIASTAKQNVEAPAASPSTPSVMLTAFDVPTMTSTAKTTHPTCPRLIPGTLRRVKESAVDVWAQCKASSAKRTAQPTWAADFARLFNPRLR